MSTALREDELYLGDNGRITCGRMLCAGSTAYHTGHDLSGQRLHRVTLADRARWAELTGEPMQCETCRWRRKRPQ